MHPGENQIRRRSDESSVTIPYDRSFRRIGSRDQPSGEEALSQFQFCESTSKCKNFFMKTKTFYHRIEEAKTNFIHFRWLRLATAYVNTERNGSRYKIRYLRYDQ